MTSAEAVTRPTNDDRIRAALWFAEHGFGVFSCWSTGESGACRCPKGAACSSPGKHPITHHGFQEATTDAARIRAMLSAASQPNYGLVPPDGVFVLDVDGDGVARLAELEARHGPLPDTLRTETSNGFHVFLRWPDGLPRPLGQMFGYIARWGSGRAAGYVIGPRSVHRSGRTYTPAGVASIATLPDVWARAAVEPRVVHVGGPADAAAVQGGGRHEFLRDRARFYAGTIRDPMVLRAAVMAENDRLAQPKSPEEVERAIGDVLERFPADPVEQDPETGETRRAPQDDDGPGMLAPAAAGTFPEDPSPEAFAGVLGSCALALAGGTDASLVGLLGSVVAICGALVPGSAYQYRLQTSSPFVGLVGESSVGRKGTAMWRALDAMGEALEAVYVNRVLLDGLNSGEGLITTLAYKQTSYPYEPCVGLVFEEEYASLLASRGREGSTLDPKMRAAFDGGPLSNRKSAGTQTVAPPYWLPALIAITPHELRKRLESDALQSGSANRWLYLPVTRRDIVPDGSPPVFTRDDRLALQAARRWALDKRPALGVAPAVTRTLSEYADFLPTVSSGTARDLTKRLPVIAFRVALIHALSERSTTVEPEHLRRALALTEYARSGIDWVFGGTVGNRDADLLLRSLQKVGSLTLHTITQKIIRDPLRRQDAIDELVRLGYAGVNTVHTTGGRPREELALTPGKGDFRAFRAAYGHVIEDDIANRARNARNSVDDLHGSRTEAARKLHESPTDVTTGEVDDAPRWLRPCRDYTAHRNHHRNTAGGWTCLACDKEEGA